MDRVIGGAAGRYWRTLALIIGTAILAAIIATVVTKANNNKKAIEKSCILLNNKIIEASAPPQTKPGEKTPTALLIEEITRHMTPRELSEYKKAQQDQIAGRLPNATLKPLDCERLADHPDEIKAAPIKQIQSAPR